MPRVKYVIAEIGTSAVYARVSISGQNEWARSLDIADAVEKEHDCDNSSCDICLALHQGFPYVAAYLLNGATETPLLDAVCNVHKFNPSGTYDKIPQWEEWVEWFKANTIECEGCGAFNYDATHCGNCLAELPKGDNDND